MSANDDEILKKVKQWLAYADEDLRLARHGMTLSTGVPHRLIAYHAQQCAEKYLKARLCEAQIPFGKIHDLVALLEQVIKVELNWEIFRKDHAYLSDFAVMFRYPGESADKKAAVEAKCLCGFFRKIARSSLKLRT